MADDNKPPAEAFDPHCFGATAARAFAALTAVEPEPAAAPIETREQPATRSPGGLSEDAIRRIADRAEQASRSGRTGK